MTDLEALLQAIDEYPGELPSFHVIVRSAIEIRRHEIQSRYGAAYCKHGALRYEHCDSCALEAWSKLKRGPGMTREQLEEIKKRAPKNILIACQHDMLPIRELVEDRAALLAEVQRLRAEKP